MPSPTRLLSLASLLTAVSLISSPAQAALQALDNQALSQVTARDGITLNLDLKTNISKISWTVSNSSGAAAGDIQNGIFNNSSSQQIASFNANATYCSGFVFLGACLFGSWYYQSNTMNATRLSFTYANDVIYPAGSYKGTVYFTASME